MPAARKEAVAARERAEKLGKRKVEGWRRVRRV